MPVFVVLPVLLPVLAGGIEPASAETEPRIAEPRVLSLMDGLSQASVDMAIKGEHRPVLLMASPTKVDFPPIKIPPASVLEFGVGVHQDTWLLDGDGMTFELSIRTPGIPEPVQVYSRHADPKNVLEDQRWFDERLSLLEYAGREVEFILTTSAGEAGDSSADWGGWSGLEIVPSTSSHGPSGFPFNLALGCVLALLLLGVTVCLRKLVACPHRARVLRMTFSLAVISIPVAYGCYPYLSTNMSAPLSLFLGTGSLAALCVLCGAMVILLMCGARGGRLATVRSTVDVVLFNLSLAALLTEAGIQAVTLFSDNPLVASGSRSETKTIQRLTAELEPLRGVRYQNGLSFNSMGFPDREFEIPKPDDVFRIVVLADSFGVMPMMPYEYNHLTLLEDELEGWPGSRKIDVNNLGMVGNGPADYLAILEEVGAQLTPDLVVLYFFLGNDFVPSGSEQVFSSRWGRFATYRVLSRLRRRYRIHLEWDGNTNPEDVRVSIPDYVGDWRLEVPFIPREQFLLLERRRARFFDPSLSEVHFAGAVRYIESIADCARELTGNPLVLCVVPEEMQVNVELRSEIEQALDKKLDIDRPLRYLRENLPRLGQDIILIDLLPRFQRAQDELERVYFLQETHWNVNGNRVAAEEAARQLRRMRSQVLAD